MAVVTFRALSCPAIRFWIGRRAAPARNFTDPLTEVLRSGARALLAQAVEAEVAALLASHADKLTETAASGWSVTGICRRARS